MKRLGNTCSKERRINSSAVSRITLVRCSSAPPRCWPRQRPACHRHHDLRAGARKSPRPKCGQWGTGTGGTTILTKSSPQPCAGQKCPAAQKQIRSAGCPSISHAEASSLFSQKAHSGLCFAINWPVLGTCRRPSGSLARCRPVLPSGKSRAEDGCREMVLLESHSRNAQSTLALRLTGLMLLIQASDACAQRIPQLVGSYRPAR
jgi:hypothetical protein